MFLSLMDEKSHVTPPPIINNQGEVCDPLPIILPDIYQDIQDMQSQYLLETLFTLPGKTRQHIRHMS